jgi:hypothetical protein
MLRVAAPLRFATKVATMSQSEGLDSLHTRIIRVLGFIIDPGSGGHVRGDEGETVRLGFAYKAGVNNYSIRLARQQRGIYHYLPDEGRSQLFQLNNSLKGVMPKLKVGRSSTIEGQNANSHMSNVLLI